MAKKKATRDEARMTLPTLAELIEEKRADLNELERIRRVKLKAKLRAMKKGEHVYARDLVKDPENIRDRTYYHPTSEGIEWTGWGRVPQWFIEAIIAGATVESLSDPPFVRPAKLGKPRNAKSTAKEMLDGAYDEILRSAKLRPPKRA